jgi:hypothetical protein
MPRAAVEVEAEDACEPIIVKSRASVFLHSTFNSSTSILFRVIELLAGQQAARVIVTDALLKLNGMGPLGTNEAGLCFLETVLFT